MEINLGDHVHDKYTGFEGTTISRTTYLDGTTSYEVQGFAIDNNVPSVMNLEQNRLLPAENKLGFKPL